MAGCEHAGKSGARGGDLETRGAPFGDLACPRCRAPIDGSAADARLECPSCGGVYPILEGIPVLIDEAASVFAIGDFVERRSLFFDLSAAGKARSWLRGLVPELQDSRVSRRNYAKLAAMLRDTASETRVLVVGGSICGSGMDVIFDVPGLRVVESDVSLGPRTQVILDAHSIPYRDQSFDCVIAQAVLEHVVDPARCVAEIHRVLRPGGLLYVETPFMQPVHGGPYDFLRFTRSGLRWLLRDFAEEDAGLLAGPGASLAWSSQQVATTLFGFSEWTKLATKAACRLLTAWTRYLDAVAVRSPRAADGACGLFFLGRRAEAPLSGRDIIAYYR